MQVLYLHGFASSPQSSKATFLARKLAERGIAMTTPDLNEPDFSSLTVSRMLGQASDALNSTTGPVAVVGSSLGGFVAVQAAHQHPSRITRVVLLAPALDFDGKRLSDLGDRGLEAWRSSNQLAVFHYGQGRMMTVHYDLYADAGRYNAFETHAQPARPDLPGTFRHGGRTTDRRTVGGDATERRTAHARRRPPAAEEPGDDLGGDGEISLW